MSYSPILNPQPVVDYPIQELLLAILIELRVHTTLIQTGLSVKDEPDDIRDDIANNLA